MKLLLTGAGGGVATQIRPLLRAEFGTIILSDRAPITDLAKGESFRLADLSDPAQIAGALAGITHVIHLGGQSVEADWPTVMERNIQGLITFYEAARTAGVQRIIFASSNHAIGFHKRTTLLPADVAPRPDSRYGVSKAFGEALASLFADKHGLQTLSIRIGNIGDVPLDRRRLSLWQHPEDFVQLCKIGLTHPDIHAQTVWGVSAADPIWWDNSAATALGYTPAHFASDHASDVLARSEAPDPVGDHFQGGTFTTDEFDGDLERTLNA